jgi:glycosyltransferase involved in cell wall biosynthesis
VKKLVGFINEGVRFLIQSIVSILPFRANALKNIDIGIVTSFYNGYGRYLPQWVDSIVALREKPSVVTIVESGSDPGIDDVSRKRCVELLSRSNIPCNYIKIETHRGMGYARNQAVNATNTEWVMYLDVDDVILPDAMDEIAKVAPRADVVCVGYREIVDGQEAGQTIYAKPSWQKILKEEHCSCSHSPFRKSLWEKSPYIEINDFVEKALWIGFAHLKARFVGTKKACTLYLRHSDSFMGKITEEELRFAKEQREKFVREGILIKRGHE